MARGGARNRSGPQPDPESGRSDRRGYSLTTLPVHGFDGDVPHFPLPQASERELEVWAEVWETPQAWAWSLPSERWRWRQVAQMVRLSVLCEDPEANSSDRALLPRYEDRVGFSTAGLAEMGWKIAEVVPEPASPALSPVGSVTSIKDRLNRGAS